MIAFVSGGCKNGKSTYAENLAVRLAKESGGPLYYVATMIPTDDEDRERIRRHIAARDGKGFITVEKGTRLSELLEGGPDRSGTFLVDSVTALLANEMFGETYDENAAFRAAEDTAAFAAGVKNAVFVSDYIYSDAALYDDMTENYRKGLAHMDRRLAGIADHVAEVSFGCVKNWK